MKTTGFKKILALCVSASFCGACAKVNFSPVPEEIASTSKTVNVSEVVAYGNKQVDFLLVFDDSNSMLPDLQKLAAGLGNFVSSLESSDIDWQMCMTTTRSISVGGSDTWGTSYNWTGYSPSGGTPAHILKRGTSNLDSIFVNTVNTLTIGGAGSGDERGIKAAYQHFKSTSSNNCYRPGAALSVIIVSNEDERSVGGDASKVKSNDAVGTYQPLEDEDMPAKLVAVTKTMFGNDIRFTFNSIIVKPGDATCEATQDAAGTSPSHQGIIYDQMSNLTEGGVGSICDSNFASSLNTFKDKIVNSMTDLTLQCVADPGTMKVEINGKAYKNFEVKKNILKFHSPLIEGTKLDLSFDCK
ncbi:MAG: hypothetical protein J7501_06550 [Bdellovibrio sp.]|nr:hypothetical protein [Bdellovibrio sp.]